MLGIGIVGLPNVGKSTLFNAITKAGVEATNYPFTTIDKNVGVVPVPDSRLEVLQRMFAKGERSPRLVPTTIEFVDVAGLVKGASRGEGLGNQFLAHLREVSAIAHVVRCFDDPNVVHIAGRVDPDSDIETINVELALADIAVLEKRLEKLKRQAKGDSEAAALADRCQQMVEKLSSGVPARKAGVDLPDDLGLITHKPVIYVCNVSEEDLASDNPSVEKVRERAARESAELVVISAKIESEIVELQSGEAEQFLAELGIDEPGLSRLVKKGYEARGLITFLTANDREASAWAVRRGTRAPQAAGTIHSDFERGFIRAEVIPFARLAEAGSMAAARAKGWVRTEGKEYVVQDGDVIHFLFNV